MGLVARIHNPTGSRCGCPATCICQRARLGRAFRWYIPPRFHKPIRDDAEAARRREAGLRFRED